MTSSRSLFTEAIEDHLALKKQNSGLEPTMPVARFDVGDPLDRYPGGPNRAAEGTVVVAEDALAAPADDTPFEAEAMDATQLLVGPSPEQAMEAATALEPAFADRPFEPLIGMTPMLSLVEDLDDEDDLIAPATQLMPAVDADMAESAPVLRFPGGVGPRESEPVATMPAISAYEAPSFSDDPASTQATGEQPVIVIDADEPMTSIDTPEPRRVPEPRRKGRSFLGLRGRKKKSDGNDSWFSGEPRDFTWDD
jgi:hypothetical protein